jgi:cytochrome P450
MASRSDRAPVWEDERMDRAAADFLEMDPFSVDVVSDPHTFYKALRDEAPVKYYPEYDTFFISRFEDVWDVLRIADNTFVSTETNLPTPEYLRSHRNDGAPPFVSTDPMSPGPGLPSPWYERMRQAHIAPLRPGAVASLKDFIQTTVDQRLDELIALGEFDLIADYAGRVNATVICQLFGIDTALAGEMFKLVGAITSVDPQQGGVDFRTFFVRLQDTLSQPIRARRAAGADGGNGLLDGLINYRMPDGRLLSDEEIVNQVASVFIAGMESASKVTAAGIMELWNRPDQLAAVRADLDANVAIAVNEMVRFTAPAQYTFRTAHRDVTVAGQAVKAGQRVACLLRSASRDEREFADPDSFVWNRESERVISFGLGQHHCMGKHLALLEVKTLTTAFLKRVKSCEFLTEKGLRNPSCFQWGWIRLPVRVTA